VNLTTRRCGIIPLVLGLALVSPAEAEFTSAYSGERAQTFLMSQSDAHSKGVDAFATIKSNAEKRGALVTEGETFERVNAISKRLLKAVPEIRPDAESWGWQVIVIQDSTPNAFCLPGGKMAVQTGLIDNLELTDDEAAAVIGHEISHALREHSREKAGQRQMAQAGVALLTIIAGAYGIRKNSAYTGTIMDTTNMLGSLGAAAFFLLPNSREMDLEADRIGVDLAAMAGYDPKAAASLWQKMNARGGGGQVDFFSTHPSHATRIQEVSSRAAVAGERFASRRVASTALAMAPRAKPKLTDSVTCVLPTGDAAALAPLACTRIGGKLTHVEQHISQDDDSTTSQEAKP
jgi:predicted Zn-dependent protease